MNKSIKFFSFLFHSIPTACAYTNFDDGKIINCNESWLELFGFASRDEVIGKTAEELNILVLERQREEIVEIVKEETIVKNLERPMRTIKGKNIWVSISILSTEIDTNPVHLFVITDITKRKEAEAELEKLNKELEQKIIERMDELSKKEWGLKMAQEISHIGNWEFDFITNKAKWSDEVYRIFGYEIGEIEPSLDNYLATFHPDDFKSSKEIIDKSLKTMRSFSSIHRSFRKDGTIVYIYSESRFLFDENGKPIIIYGITHDVTQSKLAEEKLIKQNKALSEIAFLQSHQVRKPIAQILGLINIFNEEDPTDPINVEVLAKLKETALTCDTIIRDISTKTEEIEKMK